MTKNNKIIETRHRSQLSNRIYPLFTQFSRGHLSIEVEHHPKILFFPSGKTLPLYHFKYNRITLTCNLPWCLPCTQYTSQMKICSFPPSVTHYVLKIFSLIHPHKAIPLASSPWWWRFCDIFAFFDMICVLESLSPKQNSRCEL